MTAACRDLVSTELRGRFCRLMTHVVKRHIEDAFTDAGLAVAPAWAGRREDVEGEYGVRRGATELYHRSVDWSDAEQVDRALRAWSRLLEEPEVDDKADLHRLLVALRDDGFDVDEERRVVRRRQATVTVGSLSAVTDPAVILDHLERIRRAVDDDLDPAQAIGSAKELIESTAKAVLTERGLPVDASPKLPALVTQAQQALRLSVDKSVPGPDGTAALKKVLGAASSLAIGVDELRNAGYGIGHGGGPSTRVALHARHARLAVNAAVTWCTLVLETLADERAPWRTKGETQ